MNFRVDLWNYSSVRVVVKTTGSTYTEIMNDTFGGYGFSFDIPMSTIDEQYKIVIVGISSSTTIYGYCANLY